MSIRAVAPASTANLGPGFDAAAAALELWNEVVVEDGRRLWSRSRARASTSCRATRRTSTLRAFALFAPVEGYPFRSSNRIPLERGLGSSAAAIALGLVAGARGAGESRPRAAARARRATRGPRGQSRGGSPRGRLRDLARTAREGAPARRRPAADADRRRARRPHEHRAFAQRTADSVPHAERPRPGHAAILGAAIAAGDAELLATRSTTGCTSSTGSTRATARAAARAARPTARRRDALRIGAVGRRLGAPEHAAAVTHELERSLADDTTVLPLESRRKERG